MSNITRRQDQGLGKTAAGGSGGSFAAHTRESAAPPLPQHTEFTARQARSPEFTSEVIDANWPGAERVSNGPHPDDETLTEHRFTPAGPYVRELSVTVHPDGDIAGVATYFPTANSGAGAWIDSLDDRDKLQAKVRAQRLAAMGVNARGAASDGESAGYRFTGAKARDLGGFPEATEVSKQVRKDVKRAVEFGALPSDVKVRVRTHNYSGGQAVYVDATMPKDTGFVLAPDGLDEEDAAVWKREYGRRPSTERNSIRESLQAIGNQWNDIDRDSMRDYNSSSYHLLVQVDEGEHEREKPRRP